MLSAQLVYRLKLIYAGLLRGDLCLGRFGIDLYFFLFHFMSRSKFLYRELRFLQHHIGDQSAAEQFLVRFEVELRLFVLGVDTGLLGLLVQNLSPKCGAEIGQVRVRAFQLKFAIRRSLHNVRITEDEKNGIRADFIPGPDADFFDDAIRSRRYPSNLFGNQSPKAAHLTQQLAALDSVDPNRRAIHRRSRRSHAREADGHDRSRNEHKKQVDNLLDLFVPSYGFWSRYIHTYSAAIFISFSISMLFFLKVRPTVLS